METRSWSNMAWSRHNLGKMMSEGNIPVVNQIPSEMNANQLNNNYPMLKEQIQRLESLLNQEILFLKTEMSKIYQTQAYQKNEWSMVEVERKKKQEEWESQLTKELQIRWQNILLGIEEQLQLQQSVFMQEISTIRSELAVLRDKKHE